MCIRDRNVTQFSLEKAGIIILNFTCHPLIAFTIYFCFLHSVRHSFKLANELNEAIYKVIFIGLASLTFPHILLEYLIEKNEK